MRRFTIALLATVMTSVTAWGGSDVVSPYGTLVHEDGTMVVIYNSLRVGQAYAVKVSKDGASGGCTKESISAYQLRKAFAKASSKWRAGYIPRGARCRLVY